MATTTAPRSKERGSNAASTTLWAELWRLICSLFSKMAPHVGQEHCGHCEPKYGPGGHWVSKASGQKHYDQVAKDLEMARAKSKAAKAAQANKPAGATPTQAAPASAPAASNGRAPSNVKLTVVGKTERKGTAGMSATTTTTSSTNGGSTRGAAGSAGGGRSTGSAKIMAVVEALQTVQRHEPQTLHDELAYGRELAELSAAFGDCLRGYGQNRVEAKIPPQIAERLRSAAMVVSAAGEHVLDYGRALWLRFGHTAEEIARPDTPSLKYYETQS